MSTYPVTCPVCNTAVRDQQAIFCPVCHWELIILSAEASPTLKTYYQDRLNYHRISYEHQQQVQELQQIKQAHEALVAGTVELNQKLEACESEHQQLSQQKESLEQQLSSFRNQFGEAWIQGTEKRKTLLIKWEITGSLTFRFYAASIADVFPAEIVLLLHSNHRPSADGDFEVAVKLDTTSKKMIDATTCELSVELNLIKSGKYHLRFTDLKHEMYNFLFSHKDQGKAPVFNWDKTLITI